MKNERVIVVEDNEIMREGITESLKREGYTVDSFENGNDALQQFQLRNYAAAVIDLKMEPIDGIEVLKRIKKDDDTTEVIIISAYGTIDEAVAAMKIGAYDFLTKPFSPDELRMRVNKAVDKYLKERKIRHLIETNRLLNEELSSPFSDIIGSSDSLNKVLNLVNQVAVSDSTVLIGGESGTGKELIAREIHKRSKRSDSPFIKVNCAALNDNLIESELFGHEKGSFTGAAKEKKGRFELANSGTLFLDEIGDIPPAIQIKLLRVLQEGEFERVGGEITIKTNVRIISATNRNLEKLVFEGNFREDLYYRLSVIPILLPPLRERKEDIPALVKYFINKQAQRLSRPDINITDEGMRLLIEYYYPGNIRELENLIERLCVISKIDNIGSDMIAGHLNRTVNISSVASGLPLEEALESFEKNLIVSAMKKNNGVKNRAAKSLGISTSLLYYKLEKYGLL